MREKSSFHMCLHTRTWDKSIRCCLFAIFWSPLNHWDFCCQSVFRVVICHSFCNRSVSPISNSWHSLSGLMDCSCIVFFFVCLFCFDCCECNTAGNKETVCLQWKQYLTLLFFMDLTQSDEKYKSKVNLLLEYYLCLKHSLTIKHFLVFQSCLMSKFSSSDK